MAITGTRTHNLDEFDFGEHLEGLELFDQESGPSGFSVNYHAMHLRKRCRNALIS